MKKRLIRQSATTIFVMSFFAVHLVANGYQGNPSSTSKSGTNKAAPSAPASLNPQQKAQVNQIAQQMEDACLKGTPLPPNANKGIKLINSWSADPAICGCIGKRFREAVTPEMMNYNRTQFDQFMQAFAEKDAAECTVPVVKAHLSESCEQLLGFGLDEMEPARRAKRIADLGYKDQETLLKSSCDCMRAEIKDITPRQWMNSMIDKYREWERRKQSDAKAEPGPITPIDAAMNACFKATPSTRKE